MKVTREDSVDGGANSMDSDEGVALSVDGVDGGVKLWMSESVLLCRCMAWTVELMAQTQSRWHGRRSRWRGRRCLTSSARRLLPPVLLGTEHRCDLGVLVRIARSAPQALVSPFFC